MRFHRLPTKDPRTVARDIPGICNLLFPQLLPAIIALLNRTTNNIPTCSPVPETLITKMSTNPAMLFETAYARVEQILSNKTEDWTECLIQALKQQSKYFDAELPEKLSDLDIKIANLTANNIISSLLFLRKDTSNNKILSSPKIPGYHWISQGVGDFSFETTLVEVKCIKRNFSSPDYRQILIYWLLSYSAALEGKSTEWEKCILLNPRLNKYIEVDFSTLVRIAGAGRSKIEILELFSSIIEDYPHRSLTS